MRMQKQTPDTMREPQLVSEVSLRVQDLWHDWECEWEWKAGCYEEAEADRGVGVSGGLDESWLRLGVSIDERPLDVENTGDGRNLLVRGEATPERSGVAAPLR